MWCSCKAFWNFPHQTRPLCGHLSHLHFHFLQETRKAILLTVKNGVHCIKSTHHICQSAVAAVFLSLPLPQLRQHFQHLNYSYAHNVTAAAHAESQHINVTRTGRGVGPGGVFEADAVLAASQITLIIKFTVLLLLLTSNVTTEIYYIHI